MTRLLVPVIVVLAALAVAAALWAPHHTPDRLENPTTTTGVVRSQAGEPSRPRLEPGWRLPNGHCTFTSPELAETVGAVRDPECDR